MTPNPQFMTRRELFARVKAHLLQQNRRSTAPVEDGSDAITRCAYRGAEGTSCAAGCVIKDEFYNPIFEGVGVRGSMLAAGPAVSPGYYAQSLALAAALMLSGVNPEDFGLLADLQIVHDQYDAGDWPKRLDFLEAKYFTETP